MTRGHGKGTTTPSRRAGWLISPQKSSPLWSLLALHGLRQLPSLLSTTFMDPARKSPLNRVWSASEALPDGDYCSLGTER